MTALIIDVLLGALALSATLSCGYLLMLTLLSRRTRAPSGLPVLLTQRLRFDVIVPAHDEQLLIERTVTNLLRIDWPRDCFRVVVVADNCADDTAALARAAGAYVITRQHEQLRGKGYALQFAFQFSESCNWADAVVVVDADSDVSPNLLAACAARIGDGAHALQVHYGVRNPHASWRTRLMSIALAAIHKVRSRAREHLQLSCGIRGNGWCVTHALLKEVPYGAFSLTEDIEYGIELGLAGHRVRYADEAFVHADMVSDATVASTQRRRWEHGRLKLIGTKLAPLLRRAWRTRSAVCIDLAADLLILPLSYIALQVAVLFLCAGLVWLWQPGSPTWIQLIWLGAACGSAILLYVLRGWQLSGVGARGLLDLLHAPFFVLWKVVTMARSREPLEWVRTKRRA